MNPLVVFQNQVLIGALLAWSGAQVLKLPIEYARTRSWNWSLLLRAGGMPSSHSALVTAAAHGIGLT
ncbi:MAG: divergent PAP2 family protein, partial [Anaerolineales bacterium]|nr:divergent PAP2 family protein [Anaerolineales bacterium]